MLPDQILETINRFRFGDIEFYGGFADVKIHFTWRAPDIAKVRVGHLAGTVYDAAHDGNFHALEVHGRGFDSRRRGLEIE